LINDKDSSGGLETIQREGYTMYGNISQRAVSSYIKTLADPSLTDEQTSRSQIDLHAFFKGLYRNLFEHPELYGLPVNPDTCIVLDEPNEKDKKQAVKLKLNKPRTMISQALDFLMQAGVKGRLEGHNLVLEDIQAAVKQSGIGRKFLAGLESSGLIGIETGVLSSPQYPEMMAGLQALALGCAGYPGERTGTFHFARCDFRALSPSYEPDVLELYKIFGPEEYARVSRLHEYFSARGYKTSLEIGGVYAWTVKYQGNRKVKATPFFQVSYEERYENSLRTVIKCASTNRIAEFLPQQPRFLWDDFMTRVYSCKGDECGWCRNQKSLGPSEIEYNGETRKVCWFSNGDIRVLDEPAVELIQQYDRMHDLLLPEN
jgi:hypothetical protein